MQTWTLRLGLSLIIVVGFWTNRAPAQYVYGGQQVLVAPTVPYEPERHPYTPFAFTPRPRPEPAKHCTSRILNHFGMGCQAGSDTSCTNLWSELHFVFGSCRTFYREQCMPGHADYKYGYSKYGWR